MQRMFFVLFLLVMCSVGMLAQSGLSKVPYAIIGTDPQDPTWVPDKNWDVFMTTDELVGPMGSGHGGTKTLKVRARTPMAISKIDSSIKILQCGNDFNPINFNPAHVIWKVNGATWQSFTSLKRDTIAEQQQFSYWNGICRPCNQELVKGYVSDDVLLGVVDRLSPTWIDKAGPWILGSVALGVLTYVIIKQLSRPASVNNYYGGGGNGGGPVGDPSNGPGFQINFGIPLRSQ